jgi:hypothetical protein
MAKVFGIHNLELNPGVKEKDFERFVEDKLYPHTTRPDLTVYLLKGERGERVGKYLMIFECDSLQVRDHYWPALDVESEEGEAFSAPWVEETLKYVSIVGSFTDYVVIGR